MTHAKQDDPQQRFVLCLANTWEGRWFGKVSEDRRTPRSESDERKSLAWEGNKVRTVTTICHLWFEQRIIPVVRAHFV